MFSKSFNKLRGVLVYNKFMKYSIACDEDIRSAPFTINSKFARTFPHFMSTTMLEVTEANALRLNYFINQYGEEVQQNKSMKNMQLQVKITQQIQWQRLKFVWPGEQSWILFFENPFKMYFVLKKYEKIVPIVLEQQLQLTQMSCTVMYPDAVVYGHKQSTFTNHIYSINLITFQSKQLTFSKNYQPGNRKDYWSYFSDNRLYIYGGTGTNGKPVQELFWTFNVENGNWFALDMPSNSIVLSTYGYPCEIESGKVLLLTDKMLILVELYQSRVSEVDGWREVIAQRKIENFKGLFVYNGQVFFHDLEKLIPFKAKINKVKIAK